MGLQRVVGGCLYVVKQQI